jgi:hypothetical protein
MFIYASTKNANAKAHERNIPPRFSTQPTTAARTRSLSDARPPNDDETDDDDDDDKDDAVDDDDDDKDDGAGNKGTVDDGSVVTVACETAALRASSANCNWSHEAMNGDGDFESAADESVGESRCNRRSMPGAAMSEFRNNSLMQIYETGLRYKIMENDATNVFITKAATIVAQTKRTKSIHISNHKRRYVGAVLPLCKLRRR